MQNLGRKIYFIIQDEERKTKKTTTIVLTKDL